VRWKEPAIYLLEDESAAAAHQLWGPNAGPAFFVLLARDKFKFKLELNFNFELELPKVPS
jgi:hypothetical protein